MWQKNALVKACMITSENAWWCVYTCTIILIIVWANTGKVNTANIETWENLKRLWSYCDGKHTGRDSIVI